MKNKTRAIIYTVLCVILWALIPAVSKLGQASLDNHQFLFWSSAVSFIAFLATIIVQKRVREFTGYKTADWINAVILGFLGTYLYYILLYFGYANAQGLEVLVLQYSWPVFVVLLSVIILKEKLTIKRSLAVITGFAGVVVVLTHGSFSEIYLGNYLTDLLVLAAAIVFGLFSVLSKRINLEPCSMITVYFFTATAASFISMIFYSCFALPAPGALLPVIINGLLVNGFSYIFWIKALKYADASFVAPFVFFTPVLAALSLVIFFNEPFLPVYGIGLLFVMAGGLLNK